jgi:hypothetical protein
MAKTTAWLVTLLGILLVLAAPGLGIIDLTDAWVAWIIALAVLAIGLTKLARNYSKKPKK